MKNNESFSGQSGTEDQEQKASRLDRLFGKIQFARQAIAEKLGLSGKELTDATDEALVHVAKETVAAADQDGVRTEEESSDIRDAVESAVVQGAMEEAGLAESSDGNPILNLNQGETAADVAAAIGALHEEEVVLPDGSSAAERASDVIERSRWEHMRKVSGQLGSNEGGWYEDEQSGDRFYVKFYENPSQGKVEYIANAIYAQLGIKTVHSELIQMDGREAVASPAVPNAHNIGMEAQRASKDVRDGFVADAFLANWDVIGLVYDNIVESDDGFYRIDNGGAMIFRAQGGPKEFSPDDIPELHSMLEHGSAKKVFGGITESEIRAQARDLLDKLSPEDIERIVQKSGLEGRERERVLSGLLGRREFLARNYGDTEQ